MNAFRIENVWNGLSRMIGADKIRPIIHDEDYRGLECIPRAMRDMAARKVVGRSVVDVFEEDRTAHQPRL